MARILQNELEQLKADISIQRLAEAANVQLKSHGQDLIGLCPFHDDKNPSLVITPAKNLWHCLGACQTGGSVIDWIMKAEGISFRHAVQLLQTDYQPTQLHALPTKCATTRKLDSPLPVDSHDNAILKHVVEYYHATLKQSPEALAYLKQRGIHHPEVIDYFKLGFANRSLGYRLPLKNRKAGHDIRSQLQRIGLYRNSGHEHFSGSWVIPVINNDEVLEIYGRKIQTALRKGTPLHLYLPGPHQGIFNLAAFTASKEIILCESLIDALTFWCAGFRNVTASYGCEGFTSSHINAFQEHEIERVLIAYDRDEAGNKAAENVSGTLLKMGIDCYRILFPKGMDANEYALSVTPANKSLGLCIRKAQWLGSGKPKHLPTTKEECIEAAPTLVAELEDVKETLDVSATPLPAKVIPDVSNTDIEADISEEDITLEFGERRYRIRGLKKNQRYDQLKINLLVTNDTGLHVDTFDLYAARPRAVFIKQAAIELGLEESIIKKDVGQVLLKLEALQEKQIKALTKPKDTAVKLNDADAQAALALLKSPNLLQRILADFKTCGIVGEETNKLISYLAAVSRKLDTPLAILIQSTSAAGKSALMNAVLKFIPEEEKVQYSAMTGQSLFYMGETNLKHKILAISEEEGVSQAAYALKLLQSEGELTIASTGKDESTGTLVTKEYHVEGPVMIFSTTTAIDIDEELLNRCLVLTVDEDRQQTQAIHEWQRYEETLEGLLTTQSRASLFKLHQNAQRLLKSIKVVNPYAKHLTFLDDKTRTRRDHKKYLMLIRSIALLHQYQRQTKTVMQGDKRIEYIEVTLEDIEIANKLAHEVLGRSLDELPPQTRKLLKLINNMVAANCKEQTLQRSDYHFSRRDVRTATGWSDGQLKIHCQRLQELEYLLIHRGGRGQTLQYELLYDGANQDEHPHLTGLIDTQTLKSCMYDETKLGQNTNKIGPSQAQVSPKIGTSQGKKNNDNALNTNDLVNKKEKTAKNVYIEQKDNIASYLQNAS